MKISFGKTWLRVNVPKVVARSAVHSTSAYLGEVDAPDERVDLLIIVVVREHEEPPRRRAKKIVFPRRAPSVVIPERVLVYPSPDKITCATCPCFPKEEPYKDKAHNRKLRQCQQSPPTLYELAGRVVDALTFPPAFHWSEEEVANWSEEIGLPQYRSPPILYELAGRVVDALSFPPAFHLTEEEVANWSEEIGLPQYRVCSNANSPPPPCTSWRAGWWTR
ncbi:Uncharacterized protein OBRU01_06588 [Operophtera brumata]|uniref:SAM domain-containing protein n=1 Tax=Operophtera brumata TaxID=104452 RepID=A0A0L7LK99_OPEBR|nr:Uncharacterized protein OBRU01_06588 [Operophtera brumata]